MKTLGELRLESRVHATDPPGIQCSRSYLSSLPYVRQQRKRASRAAHGDECRDHGVCVLALRGAEAGVQSVARKPDSVDVQLPRGLLSAGNGGIRNAEGCGDGRVPARGVN